MMTVIKYRIAFIVCVMFLFFVVFGKAHAHDVYTSLRSDTGQLCCGGDAITGDCEALPYKMRPDGTVLFWSNRYSAQVEVAAEKIQWLAIDASEAHWCGVPRNRVVNNGPISQAQPDPRYFTYCAFVAPGGV